MSFSRMMEIAAGSSAVPSKSESEAPTLVELAIRCAKAEALLSRIAIARSDFMRDSGGPAIGIESHKVIERWVKGYFDGSYYGDLVITPSDPVLRKILEG